MYTALETVEAKSQFKTSLDPIEHGGDWITTTLPVCALAAFRHFAAIEDLPNWLPVIHSAHVISRNENGRPDKVSFLSQMTRATIGYALVYEYDEAELSVRFTTHEDSSVRVSGWAKFSPLGHYASLMEYQLRVDRGSLPEWRDPFFENHAPSAVLSHFRDYLNRLFH